MSLKLNLASGTDLRDDWINLDIVAEWPINTNRTKKTCDIVWDARTDKIPFHDNTVDEIYAGYLFLHLAPCFHKQVMQDIYRVLKPNAILVVGEVNMRLVMGKFLENPEDISCRELIWGEQGVIHGTNLSDFDKHCHGFTEKSLYNFIESFGYKDIKEIKVHSKEVWYELTLMCHK